MNEVFADTAYFVAMLQPADEAHELAAKFTREFKGKLITSDWILAETGNFFGRPGMRKLFVEFTIMNERNLLDALTTDHHFEQAGFNVLRK